MITGEGYKGMFVGKYLHKDLWCENMDEYDWIGQIGECKYYMKIVSNDHLRPCYHQIGAVGVVTHVSKTGRKL